MLYPRVLVTGADGLIGQALVQRLADWPEADVLATGLDDTRRHTTGSGGYVPLDVTQTGALERLMIDFSPSVVVHCAALSKVEGCEADKEVAWALNVDATAHLARACHRHGARLLFLSTDFLFDGTDGPYAEDDRPNPINAYGRSKLAAENAIRLSGLNRWSIVRTSLVFGTGENLKRPNFATLLPALLHRDGTFLAATDQYRTPTYAPDLADGLMRIIRFNRDGVYHLAGRERLTVFDFAQQMATAFGFAPEQILTTTTAELHPGAPRPLDGGLLILRAESELHYRPRPLPDALAHLAPRLGVSIPANS